MLLAGGAALQALNATLAATAYGAASGATSSLPLLGLAVGAARRRP